MFCCSFDKPCPTLHDSMDCSMPGFPVPHHLPEFAQIHVHWISDAIQPSHPLSPSSPSALPSMIPSLRVFSNESALCIRWAKCWSFSFSISLSKEYSRLISFKIYYPYTKWIHKVKEKSMRMWGSYEFPKEWQWNSSYLLLGLYVHTLQKFSSNS